MAKNPVNAALNKPNLHLADVSSDTAKEEQVIHAFPQSILLLQKSLFLKALTNAVICDIVHIVITNGN